MACRLLKRTTWVAGSALAAALALSAPSWAEEPPKAYNIPAQDLGSALREFARQSNREILFSSDVVKDKTTNGVTGATSAETALAKLLAGTGLTASTSSAGQILISRADAKGASAATDPPGAPNGALNEPTQAPIRLEEIVVSAQYSYLNYDTSGTTNLPLPIEKVPQSISIVSSDLIKAADLKTLAEIAEYTPGAVNVGNQLNYGSNIMLRGFTPGRAVDGINVIQSDITFYEPDFAIFDRLEVVKGPSSVVYGVSSPGGVVNFVTKSATSQTPSYLYVQGGSWNSLRVEGQVAGALDDAQHVRAIGVVVHDQGDSFVNVVNHSKTSVYGGLDVSLGNSITGYLHGGYERYVRTVFDGVPTEPDGSPAPVPRSFFIGCEGCDFTNSVYHAEGNLTWHATDVLEFSLKSNFEWVSGSGTEDYGSDLSPTGDLALSSYKVDDWGDKNYGIGLSGVYRLETLGEGSLISIGALYQHSDQNIDLALQQSTFGSGAGNIFNGERSISDTLVSLLTPPYFHYIRDTQARILTFSGQSVLQLIDPLSLLLGVSYSKPDVTQFLNDFASGFTNGLGRDFSLSGQTSYRAGLTYEFLPHMNAYVSFSQSFNPQLYFDVDHGVLPPLKGEQYEGGVKIRTADGRLLLTGALFRIAQRNQAQYDQTVAGQDYFRAIGEVTHKGVELGALGKITQQWQVNAGYTYLDPKVTEDADTALVGQTQVFMPKQSAFVYSDYTLGTGLLRGLTLGGGIRYVSSQRTSYDGSSKDFPGYALLDATLGYAVDKWFWQLSAHNILDKRYIINSWQTLNYGSQPGDPANIALSIRRTF